MLIRLWIHEKNNITSAWNKWLKIPLRTLTSYLSMDDLGQRLHNACDANKKDFRSNIKITFEYTVQFKPKNIPSTSPTGLCQSLSPQRAKSGRSVKSGQAALKMATGCGDLSHHLHTSKKRSFAALPSYINWYVMLGGDNIYHDTLFCQFIISSVVWHGVVVQS